VGAVKHYVSLLWFLRQWNYTSSFMPKKGGRGKQTCIWTKIIWQKLH